MLVTSISPLISFGNSESLSAVKRSFSRRLFSNLGKQTLQNQQILKYCSFASGISNAAIIFVVSCLEYYLNLRLHEVVYLLTRIHNKSAKYSSQIYDDTD